MAMTVPIGPAMGRNVVPGMTKAPQPIMHPKAIAHTSIGERYLSKPCGMVSLLIVLHYPIGACVPKTVSSMA